MKIKIKDAAHILEVSEQFVRIGLQRKLFPFGFAIRPYLGQKYTYFISCIVSDVLLYEFGVNEGGEEDEYD